MTSMPSPFFKTTYEMDDERVPPMTSEEYIRRLQVLWDDLLMSDPEEDAVQDFLERHPSLLPGAYDEFNGRSGHGPMFCSVVSQPRLAGYDGKIPDFMWIAKDSATVVPVLIEIESPRKRWFTESGQRTADMTQASHQLTSWRSWVSRSENQPAFRQAFGINDDYFGDRSLQPHYVLIYGRAADAQRHRAANRERTLEEKPRETHMTYDRLVVKPDYFMFSTVRGNLEQGLTALHVPPTLEVGPFWARSTFRIRGFPEAVDRCDFMSGDRKAFLKRRIPYWHEWARKNEEGGPLRQESE